MGVYAVAFTIMRKRHDDSTEVKPFMQVVTMADPDSVEGAIEFIHSDFAETHHAKEGWSLFGDPVFFEFHQGLVKEWEPYISPAPPPKSSRAHLKVVK